MDRSSRESKLRALMDAVPAITQQAQHNYEVSQSRLRRLCTFLFRLSRTVNLLLAVLINFIILLGYGVKSPVSERAQLSGK